MTGSWLTVQVSLSRRLLRNSGPAKGLLQAGVAALSLLPSGDVLAASGDGQVVVLACNAEGSTGISTGTLGTATASQSRDLKKLPMVSSAKLAGNTATTITCCRQVTLLLTLMLQNAWAHFQGMVRASNKKMGFQSWHDISHCVLLTQWPFLSYRDDSGLRQRVHGCHGTRIVTSSKLHA